MLIWHALIILVLIALNGALAMSELAIVSSRRSRLEALAGQGSRRARAAVRLASDPGRFLSAVQIGITLVSIVAGAFSGATLGRRLGAWLDGFPVFAPHGQAIGIGVTVVVITFLTLVAGELVPKRIALARPERTAVLVARPMRALAIAAAPAVWLLHATTEAALRVLGVPATRETTVSEEEIKSLVAEATRAGVFAQQERDLIEGVLRQGDRPVKVVMTPRSKVVWVDIQAGRAELLRIFEARRFSRLLVCRGSLDHPVGYVHTKDLAAALLRDGGAAIEPLLNPLMFVPERTTVLRLLHRFKTERIHLAVVVDEFGTTEGLVTLTDVLESIAGELPERGESPESWIVRRDDGSWLVDGTLPTDEVAAVTGLDLGQDVKTTASFVLDRLRRLPETGASFVYGGARFEIVDMDGKRIDKVLIQVEKAGDTESPAGGGA